MIKRQYTAIFEVTEDVWPFEKADVAVRDVSTKVLEDCGEGSVRVLTVFASSPSQYESGITWQNVDGTFDIPKGAIAVVVHDLEKEPNSMHRTMVTFLKPTEKWKH